VKAATRTGYRATVNRLFAAGQRWAHSQPPNHRVTIDFPGGPDVLVTGAIGDMPREWCKTPEALSLLEYCQHAVPDATILMFQAMCEQAERMSRS
jgi:hypothetical protein